VPTYEYVCDACDHAFELFQSMTAPVKRKCPECSKLTLRRLIGTGAGVIFKGGGFYETDYRSESYTKAAESERKASSGDSGGGGKGSDAGGSGTGGSKGGDGTPGPKKPPADGSKKPARKQSGRSGGEGRGGGRRSGKPGAAS